MKCFYHTDNDGKCAAYWVRKCAVHKDEYPMEFIPMDYGKDFPFESIGANEQVYIVDYSIFPEEMDRLLDITPYVVWIDHHRSAIQRYEGYDRPIAGIRYDGVAGCMLTYLFFYGSPVFFCLRGQSELDEEAMKRAPLFTKLIADYDIWKFEYGDDTRFFNLGSQLYDLNPESDVWEDFDYTGSDFLYDVIGAGKIITIYRDNWAEGYCKHKGFDCEFEGHKCFAMNLAMISSDHFKSINEDDYDMFIGFSYDGESWNYSLRSAKVNCSEIAMKYGGGGHPGAAGFNHSELLLKKTE